MKNNTITFLPGWGFSPQLFNLFAKKIKGMPIFLELPLFNESDLNNLALQVAQSLPNQGTLIAWSLGGLIAIKLCTLFPNKYQRLILLSTTPRFMEAVKWAGVTQSAALKIISTFEQYPAELLKRFIRWVNHPNEDVALKKHISSNSFLQQDYDKKSLLYYLKLLFQTDLRHEYGSIKIPILHLVGEKDSIISTQPEQLTALNSTAKLCILKNAGHALFLTHQNECIRHIEHFLQGDDDGR
jgi:pimeloyl-[acyl-carrier protein] methyl ester esterase